MAGKLVKEIGKTKPFDSPQQELFLNVIRTSDHLMRAFEVLLKPFNLSAAQYNVLRILAGHCTAKSHSSHAAEHTLHEGVPCKTIGEQMITRDPDITRLLDRLEARVLISRQRNTKDRRVVFTRITPEGLALLNDLDKPIHDFHCTQLAHMSESKISQLIDLLVYVRETAWQDN